LYVYEDALRRGRTVVIGFAEDSDAADGGRQVLAAAGAESVDAARENWWIGLRSAEEERYTGEGKDFSKDERIYRRGFEAAIHPTWRGRTYDEAADTLREKHADDYAQESFKAGYQRGQDYYRGIKDKHKE
jgi:hypothetical protein